MRYELCVKCYALPAVARSAKEGYACCFDLSGCLRTGPGST
jgi:hypothetical protein